jgi:hypothetical protein
MAEFPPDSPTACYPLPLAVPSAPVSILRCLAPGGFLDLPPMLGCHQAAAAPTAKLATDAADAAAAALPPVVPIEITFMDMEDKY